MNRALNLTAFLFAAGMGALGTATAAETVAVTRLNAGYVGISATGTSVVGFGSQTGYQKAGTSNFVTRNSWAAFSIPQGSYAAATLELAGRAAGMGSSPLEIGLWDVSTPYANLTMSLPTSAPKLGGLPPVGVFNDLGGGVMYGSHLLTWPALGSTPHSISLGSGGNPSAALSAINAAAADAGTFIIGFSPLTAYEGVSKTAYLDLDSGVANGVVLRLTPVAAVPEPAEWTMLLAGLALIGFMAGRRKQKIR